MREDPLVYLGKCVRDARKKCNLTQQELADQSGFGLRHIQNIEKGVINPSYECLSALINRLGISADLLFHPDMDDTDIELHRILGKYRSCNDAEREIMLRTLECMADQFISLRSRASTSTKHE